MSNAILHVAVALFRLSSNERRFSIFLKMVGVVIWTVTGGCATKCRADLNHTLHICFRI